MLNISVTEMPANVDDDVPKRRPSVVVAVALLAASRVSLRSLETLETPVRPDDTEIPESSESEPWREYEDLDGEVNFDLYSEVYEVDLGTVLERLEKYGLSRELLRDELVR